jgi:hypothetical protein
LNLPSLGVANLLRLTTRLQCTQRLDLLSYIYTKVKRLWFFYKMMGYHGYIGVKTISNIPTFVKLL